MGSDGLGVAKPLATVSVIALSYGVAKRLTTVPCLRDDISLARFFALRGYNEDPHEPQFKPITPAITNEGCCHASGALAGALFRSCNP